MWNGFKKEGLKKFNSRRTHLRSPRRICTFYFSKVQLSYYFKIPVSRSNEKFAMQDIETNTLLK